MNNLLIKKYQAIINNSEVETEASIDLISPWDLKIFANIGIINQEMIANLVDIATSTQKKWKKYSLLQRIEKLKTWIKLIKRDKEEIAHLISISVAKNYDDSLIEVNRTIAYCYETFASAKRLLLKTYDCCNWEDSNKIAIYKYEPKGVVLAISPFNYPLNLALNKIIPSLVMGNTVLWKPASQGLLIGWKIAQLAAEAKLKKGIFNVVFSKGSEIKNFLIAHPNIDLILFTGSIAIGNKIKKLSYSKDFVLEMGGKDFAIVLNDNNIAKTAQEIIQGAFSYSGQRCTAIKGVIVYDYIADPLILNLEQELKTIRIKNKDFFTPLININAVNFAKKLIKDALDKKAKLIIGNKSHKNFLEPTILDQVNANMMITSYEQFAPVLPILRVQNHEEIIKIVNNLKFGLQCAIFSANNNEAWNLGAKLDVARVNINCRPKRGPDILPFTGFKSSGFNYQGLEETLKAVTKLKGYNINLNNNI